MVVKREHSGARLPGFALVYSETLLNSLFSARVSSYERGELIIVSETFKLAHQILLASPLYISAPTGVTSCVTSSSLYISAA